MNCTYASSRHWQARLALGICITTLATSAMPVNVVASNQMSVEPLTSSAIRIRKLGAPGELKYGVFVWDAVDNAYKLSGSLYPDDTFYGNLELWKKYGVQATVQSEKLTAYVGGVGVSGVQIRSPAGVTYAAFCRADGSSLGFNSFACDSDELPAGQTQFGAGLYLVTFTLASGGSASRSYYVGGGYPTGVTIVAPAHGSTNVSTAPTLRWRAVSAARYDVIIREQATGKPVYGRGLHNAVATSLSLPIPAAKLSPNTAYVLTIEALGPLLNGGAKGIKRESVFTTGP